MRPTFFALASNEAGRIISRRVGQIQIQNQKEGGSYLDRGHRRLPLFVLATARDFRDRLGFRLNTAESADFFSFRRLSTTSGKSLFL